MRDGQQLRILTGFRFFAALHVVCFHNFYLFGEVGNVIPTYWYTFVQTGESAVSFFFILSGFILTHVYKEKLSSKKEKTTYFIARIAKLYPLYLLALLMDAPRVCSYFLNTETLSVALAKIGVSGGASLLMLQSWVPRLTATWNPPAWSLSCEIFFYVCFIFLMKPLLRTRHKVLPLLLFYILPLLLFLFISQMADTENLTFRIGWRSFPPFRVFEFLLGISLYNLMEDKNRLSEWIRRNSSRIFWGALLTSLVCTSLYQTVVDLKIFPQLVLAPLFSLMIVSASGDRIWGQSLFTNRFIYHLGIVSYAIYILHQPFKNYLVPFLEPSLTLGFIYFAGLIGCCLLAHRWIEAPLQEKIKSTLKLFT